MFVLLTLRLIASHSASRTSHLICLLSPLIFGDMFKRFPYRFEISYVKLGVSEHKFWQIAARHVPFSYRWFPRSLSLSDVDAKLSSGEWEELKSQIKGGDKICRFGINPDSMAMRRGYVVIRRRKPIGGIIVEVS